MHIKGSGERRRFFIGMRRAAFALFALLPAFLAATAGWQWIFLYALYPGLIGIVCALALSGQITREQEGGKRNA